MNFTKEYITDGEFHAFEIEEIIYEKQSDFQHIQIIKTKDYGVGLFIDGRIQHLEKEEYLYSEIMVHPAVAFLREKCNDIACIGGGPGGVIRELLKYSFVKSVEQIEIDSLVIDLSKKYLSHINDGAFNDPRYHLSIHEAKSYFEKNNQLYDLIINDLNEPFSTSISLPFFKRDTISIIHSRLHEQGLYVCWGGSATRLSIDFAHNLYEELNSVFAHVYPLYNHMQTYGTSWVTFICSKKELDFETCIQSLNDFLSSEGLNELFFFDEISLKHMINLPKEIRFLKKHE